MQSQQRRAGQREAGRSSKQLVNELKAFQSSHSQSDLNKVCETFLNARAWWEKSEAFLFGAANDFGIDPHIDSWPLDVDAFNNLMSSPNMLAVLAGEDGDVVAGEQLGNALLGFHGIEYILFNNGQVRNASEITETQMVYAVAVAGDLRNRCFQLEVSWIGDAAPKSHRDKVEELELNSTVNGGSYSYGDNLKKAGNPGSTYASSVSGLMAIVDGCKTIADEVGTSKIGKPYNGEDANYIESPYSQKSQEDGQSPRQRGGGSHKHRFDQDQRHAASFRAELHQPRQWGSHRSLPESR